MKNTLIKYNNYRSIFDQLTENIFQDVFNDPFFLSTRNWKNYIIDDNEKEYTIEIELPRLKLKDIKATVAGNSLCIAAQNDRTSFSKSFEFWDADVEKADLKLDSGVLTVKIPKKNVESKEKQLEIKEVKDAPQIASG